VSNGSESLGVNTLQLEFVVCAPGDELEFTIIFAIVSYATSASPQELLCFVISVARPNINWLSCQL
jgi:hypothetical protein